MITVAVTGGIGSGKSTVSTVLRDHGAVVVDSDHLAREVVAPGSPGLAAIAQAFGPAILTADGALDRAALAAVVFADPAARRQLELITHPRVRGRFEQIRAAAPAEAVVVNDIPLLTTLAQAASFHLVIGVRAEAEIRVERLIGRGLTEVDARARIAAQLSDEQRAPLCDVMLANHGPRTELAGAVDGLWTQRLIPFESNVRAGRRAERGAPRLVAPRASWADDARRLAARISAAAGGARVDHIGSTAIPGLPAKDVLDLQLTVDSLDQADALAPALAAAGFPTVPGIRADTPHPESTDPAGWVKQYHANADPGQSLNLHVRVRDWPNWRCALLLRDWLIADPAAIAEYRALKEGLAQRFAGDPD
ncbi:MAG TPA: dephospho-CoA kinase, partial [Nakamurella multipartita]|nr:dephospho-CoA kinase [Nakamurella multipartita]